MLINVYVASPDPDPNPWGGGQLPNPNPWGGGQQPNPNPWGGGQLPNPNECNFTLTSRTNNIYPYSYIDVNDRGHRFRSGSPLTNYPHALASSKVQLTRIFL